MVGNMYSSRYENIWYSRYGNKYSKKYSNTYSSKYEGTIMRDAIPLSSSCSSLSRYRQFQMVSFSHKKSRKELRQSRNRSHSRSRIKDANQNVLTSSPFTYLLFVCFLFSFPSFSSPTNIFSSPKNIFSSPTLLASSSPHHLHSLTSSLSSSFSSSLSSQPKLIIDKSSYKPNMESTYKPNVEYVQKVSPINNDAIKSSHASFHSPSSSSFSSPFSSSSPSFASPIFTPISDSMSNGTQQKGEKAKQKRNAKSVNFSQNGGKISSIILRSLVLDPKFKPQQKIENQEKIGAQHEKQVIEPRDGQSRSKRLNGGAKIPSLFNFNILKKSGKFGSKIFKEKLAEKKQELNKDQSKVQTKDLPKDQKKKIESKDGAKGKKEKVTEKEIHIYTRPLIFTNDPIPDQLISLRRDSVSKQVTVPNTKQVTISNTKQVTKSKSITNPKNSVPKVSNVTSSSIKELDTSASDHQYRYHHVYPDNFNLPGPKVTREESSYPFRYTYSLDRSPGLGNSGLKGLPNNGRDYGQGDMERKKRKENKYRSKWSSGSFLDQDFAPSDSGNPGSRSSYGSNGDTDTSDSPSFSSISSSSFSGPSSSSSSSSPISSSSSSSPSSNTFTAEDAKPTSSSSSYSYGAELNPSSVPSKPVKYGAIPYGYRKAAFSSGSGQDSRGHESSRHDSSRDWIKSYESSADRWKASSHGHHDGGHFGENGQPSDAEELTLALTVNTYGGDEDRARAKDRREDREKEQEKERREKEWEKDGKRRKYSDDPLSETEKIDYNSAGIDAGTRLRNSNLNSHSSDERSSSSTSHLGKSEGKKKYNPLDDDSSDDSSNGSANQSANESDEEIDKAKDRNKIESSLSSKPLLSAYAYRIRGKNKLKKYNKYKDFPSPWDYDHNNWETTPHENYDSKKWLSAILNPTSFRNRDTYRQLVKYYTPRTPFKNYGLDTSGFMPPIVPSFLDPATAMMLMSSSVPRGVATPPFFPQPGMAAVASNAFPMPVLVPPMVGNNMRLPIVPGSVPWMRQQFPIVWPQSLPVFPPMFPQHSFPLPQHSHQIPQHSLPLMNQRQSSPSFPVPKVYESRIPSPFISKIK